MGVINIFRVGYFFVVLFFNYMINCFIVSYLGNIGFYVGIVMKGNIGWWVIIFKSVLNS